MKKDSIIAIILVGLFLSACAQSGETEAVPTVKPPTSTYEPTKTPTVVPSPTSTTLPTETPEPTALPGILVYPVDTLYQDIPWLPLNEDERPTSAYYGFNMDLPPFNNVLVRQAFAAAIDRKEIAALAERFYFRNARPATSLTPPETLGRDLYGEVGIPFNPSRARNLLSKAGYDSVESFPSITLIVGYRGDASPGAYIRMADAIVAMWLEHLGVTVKVEVIGDFFRYMDRLRTDLPHIYQITWGADYNDPDNFLREIFHTDSTRWNMGHFSNMQFDRLVEQAASSKDPVERQQLYILAERILTEEIVGIIPLYHSYWYLGE